MGDGGDGGGGNGVGGGGEGGGGEGDGSNGDGGGGSGQSGLNTSVYPEKRKLRPVEQHGVMTKRRTKLLTLTISAIKARRRCKSDSVCGDSGLSAPAPVTVAHASCASSHELPTSESGSKLFADDALTLER